MLSGLSIEEKLVVVASIILSVAIHESMHALVAYKLGDSTAADMGRLTLNPLKHIDILTTVLLPIVLILLGLPPFFIARPVPFNPNRVKFGEYGAALVGIAGPVSNFLLAAIASIFLRIFARSLSPNFIGDASLFIQVNIIFFVFNMIPFPPLDGSRLLYAFAPEPVQKIMYKIESTGFMALLIFVLLFYTYLSSFISGASTHIFNFLLGQ